MYRIDILTLFDLTVGDVLSESILGRAQERDILRIEAHQIRDYTLNKQKQVDDYPYGGGHGAVMQADPLFQCWKHVVDEFGPGHTIYFSPAGTTFKHVSDIYKTTKWRFEMMRQVMPSLPGALSLMNLAIYSGWQTTRLHRRSLL